MPSPFRLSREVYVPQFENGSLQYIMFEIISNSETDSGWTIKEQPKQNFPTATGPTAVHTIAAFDSLESQKKGTARTGAAPNAIGWGRNTILD